MTTALRSNLLRERGHGHARVGFMELFFDLVFVFAVTQLSHNLLAHFTPLGAVESLMLLLATWWAWVYTTWATNWLDPERLPVRVLLIALMGVGLFIAMAIPQAFAGRGLVFAGAYIAMQLGRTLFTLWALHGHSPANFRSFRRISIWFAFSGLFWIAGGIATHDLRLVLWLVALAIDYSAPSLTFYVPGLGRSATTDWDVEGGHIAERCGLFVIIALGESILITGATFAELTWTTSTVAAFVSAFAATITMWWLYFNIAAERGSHLISGTDDPGRLARIAYTYMHLPIIAGVIVIAASDELVLAHPDGHTSWGTASAIIGGSALYLLGNGIFKRLTARWFPLSHLVGLGAFATLVAAVPYLSPVMLSIATTLLLIVVAIWETISLGIPGTNEPGEAS
jgi:low temperature requirement protein LtrA